MSQQGPHFSDDPVRDSARRALLTKLAANTKNPGMAELARELLAGNITPREVIASPTLYADVLNTGAEQFTAWYDTLSEVDKEAAATRGEQAEHDLAQPPQPPKTPRRTRPTSDENPIEDFSEKSWMQRGKE
ncbi:hypothetical protein ACOBQX_24695 [Actinokineospora sp. G85]|uniref:hypothetical protein n=1 Tax=Actinokineospora sp. G85 TaxID=3406626 RepID=UPI003C714BF5